MKPINQKQLITILVLIVISGFSFGQGTILSATPKEAKAMQQKEKMQLLDVRTLQEWQEDGYIKGAIHIDYYAKDFETRLKQLDKQKPVLVYCAVGGRSARATKKLADLGFQKVINLEGGIYQWQQDGMPVELAK